MSTVLLETEFSKLVETKFNENKLLENCIEEETGISNNDYKILHNVLPFQEMFIGSNNIKYKI